MDVVQMALYLENAVGKNKAKVLSPMGHRPLAIYINGQNIAGIDQCVYL